jgi:hypothetical protein
MAEAKGASFLGRIVHGKDLTLRFAASFLRPSLQMIRAPCRKTFFEAVPNLKLLSEVGTGTDRLRPAESGKASLWLHRQRLVPASGGRTVQEDGGRRYGTPPLIINKVYADVVRAMATPSVRDLLAANGTDAVASTPREFAAWLKNENNRWAPIVKASDAKVD